MLTAQRVAALSQNPTFASLRQSLAVYYGHAARDALDPRMQRREGRK